MIMTATTESIAGRPRPPLSCFSSNRKVLFRAMVCNDRPGHSGACKGPDLVGRDMMVLWYRSSESLEWRETGSNLFQRWKFNIHVGKSFLLIRVANKEAAKEVNITWRLPETRGK
jgi:hypothetical protein